MACGTLILSSSFPRFKGDYAGHFVAESCPYYSARGPVTVLAPDDAMVDNTFRMKECAITRFKPCFAKASSLFYGYGGPENIRTSGGIFFAPLAFAAQCRAAHPLLKNAERVTAHWLVPSGLTAALFAPKGAKLQLVVHGGDWNWLKNNAMGRMIVRYVLRRADDVVVVANYLREDLCGLFLPKERERMEREIRVLPMGLDVAHFAKGTRPSRQTRRVLAVGRLVPIKGFDRLIRALRGQAVEIRLVGEGPERAKLETLARRSGVPVCFLGRKSTEEMAALYRESSILVLPSHGKNSRGEGLPRVLLEGMAAGCAVVATRCGGIGDVLRHGENALLDDGDETVLRDNITRLLDDPDEQLRLQEVAQRDALKYDWSVIGPKLARTLA